MASASAMAETMRRFIPRSPPSVLVAKSAFF
jgi:hypothetical protein